MSTRWTFWVPPLAAISAAAVLTASYFVYGQGTPGAHVATLQTARFSALWFALALLARSTWPQLHTLFEARGSLTLGFVAAHLVHYSAVMLFAYQLNEHPLHSLQPSALGYAGGGFLLLVIVATTAKATGKLARGLHATTIYLIWFLFMVALSGAVKTSKFALFSLTCISGAMLLRIASAFRPKGQARAAHA